jgi:translation elongation factor EF-G
MAHGDGEYAHVSLRLHPAEAGSVYSFEDTTIGGAIPKRFMTSIEAGIRASMAKGVLRGYPIVGVRVEVHDGSYHETDSTDAGFTTAAALTDLAQALEHPDTRTEAAEAIRELIDAIVLTPAAGAREAHVVRRRGRRVQAEPGGQESGLKSN